MRQELVTPIEDVEVIVKEKGEAIVAEMTAVLHDEYGLQVYEFRTASIMPSSLIPGVAMLPPDSQATRLKQVLEKYDIFGYEVPVAEIGYPEAYLGNRCSFYFRFRQGKGAQFGWSCSSTG